MFFIWFNVLNLLHLCILDISIIQVFAAITADAKLQIWDLSVSNLDPIESYDTSIDDVTAEVKEEVVEVVKEERTSTAGGKPGTAASSAARYEVHLMMTIIFTFMLLYPLMNLF